MTNIEWTEHTWNPVTGCTKISAGCKHCYAATMAKRLQSMGTPGYDNAFNISLMPDRLEQPLDRKKPTMFFVCSMSDLFHESVPFAFIDQVFQTIKRANQHTFQILTKRANRMKEYFTARSVPDNAWIGVTVENRKEGIPRIIHLKSIQSRTRFLSVEPLLEDLGQLDLSWIHQVIVGGESGKGARQMQPKWVDNIFHWCQVYDVPFFLSNGGFLVLMAKSAVKKSMAENIKAGTGITIHW